MRAVRELTGRESTRRERTGRDFNPDRFPRSIVVDEVGLGGGVVDRLREQRVSSVKAFNGVRRPSSEKRRTRFANLRAEAYWDLREALQNEELALPPDEDLHEELLALEWRVNSAGKIEIISKDELRPKLRRSPDRADALSMGVWRRAGRTPQVKPLHY